jgi:hypothetical protein
MMDNLYSSVEVLIAGHNYEVLNTFFDLASQDLGVRYYCDEFPRRYIYLYDIKFSFRTLDDYFFTIDRFHFEYISKELPKFLTLQAFL